MKKPALLIVDVQEDFCPPNGSLAVPNARSILPTINTLLALPFTLKIATKDHHPPDHISFYTSHPREDDGISTAIGEGEGDEKEREEEDRYAVKPFESTIEIVNPVNGREVYVSQVWPPHCVVGTKGNEFAFGLNVIPEDEDDDSDTSSIDEDNDEGREGEEKKKKKKRVRVRVVHKGTDRRLEMYSAFRTPLRNPPMPSDVLDLDVLDNPEDVNNNKGQRGGAGGAGGELTKMLVRERITDVIVVGLAGDYCIKESALDCVQIGRELAELRRIRRERMKTGKQQQQPPLSSSSSKANGNVNGHAHANKHTSGHTNGHANGTHHSGVQEGDDDEGREEEEEGKGLWNCWVVQEGVRSVGGDEAWSASKKILMANGVKVVDFEQVKKRFFPDA